MMNDMTRELTDTPDDFIPDVEQETQISAGIVDETTESATNDELLKALDEIDLEVYEDDDTPVIIDVFDYDSGTGTVDIPLEIWPESPSIFLGSTLQEDAILLSPSGDNPQFISARPSSRKVYEMLVEVLSDLNGHEHWRENTGEIQRGLLEYVLFELNKAGVTLYMTNDLVEEVQPMEYLDFDYYVKAPMMKSTKGKGNSILTLMAPLLRSQYGGIGFSLTVKEEDEDEKTRCSKIYSDLDRQHVGLIRSATNYKLGHQNTLIIVPDDYRQITLEGHLKKFKRIDCKVVSPNKAEAQLATGKYPRVIVLDLMDQNILDMLGDPDVADLIRRTEITYGIAYGKYIPQAPNPIFYELQEIICGPIRLVL